MVIQIQIGWAVQWIGRTLPDITFSLGSTMISWSSKKQGSLAQSTGEADCIVASAASREAVWLKKILSVLKLVQLQEPFSRRMEKTLAVD
jgi:hypothetical protein